MIFDMADKIDDVDEWVDYFWKNLYVGIELELENDEHFRDKLRRNFGVGQTPYHEYGDCDNCPYRNRCTQRHSPEGCHVFFRDNLIVSIQDDATVSGSEFLLHTGTMSTEQFIKRLPIQKFEDLGYYAGRHGSIHVHLIIPYFKRDIPMVILENFWNLFRYYYCGFAYLVGTSKSTCLRNTQYSMFSQYRKTLSETLQHSRREAVNLGNLQWNRTNKIVTRLDVEVRTADNSLNVNHIALVRFLSRLLWIRATEISEYGKLMMRETKEWKERKKVIRILNLHKRINNMSSGYYGETDKNEAEEARKLMKEVSEELYVELQHLMTEQEKDIFKGFIEEPVWLNRTDKLVNVTKKKKSGISEFDRALLCIVKTKSIITGSRKQYYKQVAKQLDSTTDYVRTRLGKINSKWNPEIGAYEIKHR